MAKVTFKIVNNDNEPLPNAAVNIVFRAKAPFGWFEFNTGVVDVKADAKGIVTVDIPAFTDHLNVTAQSGGYIGTAIISGLSINNDWAFIFNPIASLIAGGVTSLIPIDVTKMTKTTTESGDVETGTSTIISEYNPLRVAGYKANNAWQKFTDWVSKNLITLFAILVIFAIVTWILLSYAKPIISAGKGIYNKVRSIQTAVKGSRI